MVSCLRTLLVWCCELIFAVVDYLSPKRAKDKLVVEQSDDEKEKQALAKRIARDGQLSACKALVGGCRDDDERRKMLNVVGENNWTVLHYAAMCGRDGVIEWVLSDGEGGGRRLGFDRLMARDQRQRTALHLAAQLGHLFCCKALVDGCRDDDERKELLNALDCDNWTALHYASWKGREEVTQWLLSNDDGGGRRLGFDSLMVRDQLQRTALHVAAQEGHLSSCKVLVGGCRDEDECKELLNAVGEHNWTILHYAAWQGCDSVTQWLLSDDEGGGRRLGFDGLMARDHEQRTVLHLAARLGHISCCKALVGGCRDDDERRELLNALDCDNWTALHYAASYGHPEVAQWLLSDDEGGGRRLGFDGLMARDQLQRTVLHLAARLGHLSCCKALVDGCRDDDERKELWNAVGEHNWTILHYAARFGCEEVIQWLLSDDDGGGRRLGFDRLMARDSKKRTALHLAAQLGHLSCCKALVGGCRDDNQRKELLNALDCDNWTALYHAAWKGCDSVTQWLLSADEGGGRRLGFDALLMVRDQLQRTVLHLAARSCCKVLVDCCQNDDERRELLNAVGEYDWTVLHYAASHGREEVIKWVLSDDERGGRRLGFDGLMVRDQLQRTALHLAAQNGHLSCCKALVNGCRDDDERRELLNAVGEYDTTALHCAARFGRDEIAQWLLSDDDGGGRRLGFDSLMKKETFQRTALHLAARHGHLLTCIALVDGCRSDDERRELLNAVDENDWTTLHHAARDGRDTTIEWLLSDDEEGGRRLGFDRLMARNKDQETALHLAAENNHPRAFQALLDGCRDSRERIALIQAVDDKGKTILHHSLSREYVDIIKWIVRSPEMELIYNLKDNDGFTALHGAILAKFCHQSSILNVVNALLFDTEAENQAIIDDNDDNRKDRKRIATKIDPNIGCGLDWNP